MVVATDDGHMIVGDESWWPGAYASRAVAERAEATFTAEQITALVARVGGRLITGDDLDALAEEIGGAAT